MGIDGFFVSPQRAIKKGCIKKQILKKVVGGAVKKNIIKKSIIKKSVIKKRKKKNILRKALLPAVVGGVVVGGAAVTGAAAFAISQSLLEVYEPLPGSMIDETVLITGGSSGLGLETAKRLGAAGATIVLTSRTQGN